MGSKLLIPPGNRAIRQSALACSMRSFLEDTKFHQMCREIDLKRRCSRRTPLRLPPGKFEPMGAGSSKTFACSPPRCPRSAPTRRLFARV